MTKKNKINKKACRPYADPKHTINANNGLLLADNISYIVRTAVKNIGGKRLLLLYVYDRKQAAAGQFIPSYTIFQGRDDYITLVHNEDGTSLWRAAAFERLDSSWNFTRKCTLYSAKDSICLERYCNGRPLSGLRSLEKLQQQIIDCRRLIRQQKRERETIRRMASIPALPRGLKGWVHSDLMPTYLFYDYSRKKGKQTAYCTTCRKDVIINNAHHNAENNCPRCKKKAIFKSRGKRGRISDRITCQVIQKLGTDELILRIVKVYYNFVYDDNPQISICENARCFIRAKESNACQNEYYYDSYISDSLTSWQPGTRPVFCRWFYHFEADRCGYLYTKNLDTALQGTRWQYCQLKSYYVNDPVPLTAGTYLNTYIKYPLLEYLVKFQLQKLADHLVFGYIQYENVLNVDGRNIQEILGIERKHFTYIQSLNPDTDRFRFIRTIIQTTGSPDEELIYWCDKHNIQDADLIHLPLTYTTSHKLICYAESQFQSSETPKKTYWNMENLLRFYRDYLRMCDQLHYDLANDFVLYPRHLKKSHDKVSELMDVKKVAVYDQQIKEQFSFLQQKYQFAHSGFLVIPPLTAKEIVKEGHRLRHCVGSYVRDVVKRKCSILFIRSEKEPLKPLCTIEIVNNKIKQARCFKNSMPSDDIKDFIALWQKKVLQIPKSNRTAA